MAQYMADVLEDSKDKVQENLLANGGKLMSHDLMLTCIKWMTKLQKQKKEFKYIDEDLKCTRRPLKYSNYWIWWYW